MNTKRIQDLLAALNAHVVAPLLACQAHALLSELCAPDGAIGIADQAAYELIQSECVSETFNDVTWYYIHSTDMALILSEDEGETAQQIGRAVRYLSRRELLKAHPTNSCLVTWNLSSDSSCSG
jgi:hypothetical protein